MLESGWDRLIDGLATTLAELPDGTVLLLVDAQVPERGHYAQFRRDDAVLAEISANRSVAPPLRLPAQAAERFRADGWHEPDDEVPNWWLEYPDPQPDDLVELARTTARALRDVIGIAGPDRLRYHAWCDPSPEPLELPALGLGHLDGSRAALMFGLQQTDVSYFAWYRDGRGTQPAGLLRRRHASPFPVDDELGADGVWRPTDVIDEADSGGLGYDLVAVSPERAEAIEQEWSADGSIVHLARAADATHDADGRPVPPTDRLADVERSRVVDYLGTAPLVVAAWGYDKDPFDATGSGAVPLSIRTDGRWAWSESWAYFADRYGFAPEPGLLERIRSADYRPPRLDDDTLAQIARRLREQR